MFKSLKKLFFSIEKKKKKINRKFFFLIFNFFHNLDNMGCLFEKLTYEFFHNKNEKEGLIFSVNLLGVPKTKATKTFSVHFVSPKDVK